MARKKKRTPGSSRDSRRAFNEHTRRSRAALLGWERRRAEEARRSAAARRGHARRREREAKPQVVRRKRSGKLEDVAPYAPQLVKGKRGRSLWLWHAPKREDDEDDGGDDDTFDADAAFAVLHDFHHGAGERVLGKRTVQRRLAEFANRKVRVVLTYEFYDVNTNTRVRRTREHEIELGDDPRARLFGSTSAVGDMMRRDLQDAYEKAGVEAGAHSVQWLLTSIRIVEVRGNG